LLPRGANAAVVGNEFLQFQTATLGGPGQYVLGGLLRGRLGTDDAVGSHVAGERFALLDGLEALVRVCDGLARVGVPSTYKVVSLYQPFDDATPSASPSPPGHSGLLWK
jgi:hypothetical protein